jgi:hypothetical protein
MLPDSAVAGIALAVEEASDVAVNANAVERGIRRTSARRASTHGSGTWLPQPGAQGTCLGQAGRGGRSTADFSSGNYQYDWMLNLVRVPNFFLLDFMHHKQFTSILWLWMDFVGLEKVDIYIHVLAKSRVSLCTESLQRVFTGILASIATHRAGELLGLARVTSTQEL